MKKTIIYGMATLMIFSLSMSCKTVQNTNHKQRGAAVGAASGALIGGILGNNVGKGNNTVLGAIVGAVVGGVAGGYIGDRMDKQAQEIEEAIPGAEVTRVGEGINVVFNEDAGVYFDTNKSNVKGASVVTLDKMADILKEYEQTNILVVGHTDSAGADEYNLKLSQQRAESVTNYLKVKSISVSRLTTEWYGETQPVADNGTTEGKAKNRRVEMAIVANEALKKEAIDKTNN